MTKSEKILIASVLSAGWFLYKNGIGEAISNATEAVDATADAGADFYVNTRMKFTEAKRAFEEEGLFAYWESLSTIFESPEDSFNSFMKKREDAGLSFKYYEN